MGKQLFKSLIILGIFFTCSFTMAQKTVTGTVSDADGPLPGAAVVVQGTSNGVTTDFDGNYSIEANEGDVLEFSFIGMTSATATVGADAVINITLAGGENTLEEVVVVGYSTQTRGDITGSVGSVDMEEAMKVPTANAAEALQGRVTGVTVNANPAPGAAPTVNIRGIGSSNGTGPLYIIDGVQTTDPNVLQSINPGDIEQMNVLKDGAAAIYGSRASNGVIIVTTKGGSYNLAKSSVSVDVYTGMATAVQGISTLNTQQHADMLWEGMLNDQLYYGAGAPSHPQYGSGVSPVIPTTLNLSQAPGREGISATVKPGGTNWWDEITQSAPIVSATVSLEGGTETSKSFMSVGYLNQGGVIQHTGYARANMQVNNEFKPIEKLKIGQHLNASWNTTQPGLGEPIESALRASPLIPVYDDAGNFAGTYSNSTGLSNTRQPYAQLYRAKDNYINNSRLFGDIYLSYEIIEGLTFKTTFAGSIAAFDQRSFTPLDPEHGEPLSFNTLWEQDQNFFNWTWTNMLMYNTTINDNHNINAFIATEALESSNKGKQVSRTDYFNETPNFYLLSNGFADPAVDWAYANGFTLFSVFGSADYNYKQKYFATATVRYDKSSRFAGDNKSDVFPSFSAGWVVSKEDFFNETGVVNRLKIKASWGQLGSQDLPVNNPTQTLYAFNQNNANYVWGGQGSPSSGAIVSQIGNANLQWEKSITSNLGVELGFLENKLTTSIEFYQITTDGLFARDNNLIPTTGPEAPAPFVNLGEIKNTGIDWSVAYNNTWDSGFTFGVLFNLSHYKNEVTSLINGTPINGNATTSWAGAFTRTEEGEPISYFFGRKVSGLDDIGRFTYEDVNGDGQINDDDRTKIGSPHPDFTYGLNLNAGYKGFDLSAFFNGSQGNDVYNQNLIFTDFPLFVDGNRRTEVLNAWTPTNTNTKVPALSNSLHGTELNANSYFVEDGSFFRLRNLQIGYSLPTAQTDKMGMERFRIYLQGTNLFTITSYSGVDPEVQPRVVGGQSENLNMGIDSRVYPVSRIFSIGLNIKF